VLYYTYTTHTITTLVPSSFRDINGGQVFRTHMTKHTIDGYGGL